jgi:hypothetical protein
MTNYTTRRGNWCLGSPFASLGLLPFEKKFMGCLAIGQNDTMFVSLYFFHQAIEFAMRSLVTNKLKSKV